MFKGTWLDWFKGAITVLLVTICAGAFMLAWQTNLTSAVKEVAQDHQTATYNSKTHHISAICTINGTEHTYSTVKQYSSMPEKDLTEARIWGSGYIGLEFSDRTVFVFSNDNCVVSSQPLR